MSLPQTHPCPRCNRMLQQSGLMVAGDDFDIPVAIFQCDECIIPWKFVTKVHDTALTFAVDERGNLYDGELNGPVAADVFCPH